MKGSLAKDIDFFFHNQDHEICRMIAKRYLYICDLMTNTKNLDRNLDNCMISIIFPPIRLFDIDENFR